MIVLTDTKEVCVHKMYNMDSCNSHHSFHYAYIIYFICSHFHSFAKNNVRNEDTKVKTYSIMLNFICSHFHSFAKIHVRNEHTKVKTYLSACTCWNEQILDNV